MAESTNDVGRDALATVAEAALILGVSKARAYELISHRLSDED
uniref:Uncharacterized protein n=1 Tax=uncultured bacterium W5-51b TaxID=1130999 RepID=H9BX71_9BACT|nr:hypothetical protein [uncultured bacterium W5-51b]